MAVTFRHGDFYGLNVHLAGPDEASPLLIDWNCARVGPAMFDVAMAVGVGHRRAPCPPRGVGPGNRSPSGGGRGTALPRVGAGPEPGDVRPVVALRGARERAGGMTEEAERAWREYGRLAG